MGGDRVPVVVAMSGGVDSSVAAALLLREGHEVMGVTLRLQPCEDQGLAKSCCGVDAALQARRVADQLGIPHAVLDCRQEFQAEVLRPAWDEYAAGRTPNPCVRCNSHIKFGYLLQRAGRLGAGRVATGHYARVAADGSGRPRLARAKDLAKDQTYFLFALSAEQLSRTLFPLGGMSKPEVRAAARELGLATAERPESQDACLNTSEDGFAESLRQRFDAEPRPGRIVGTDGRELGRHDGLHRFTVGQRRGLGISAGARAFVAELRSEDAAVVVTTDPSDLWAGGVEVRLLDLPARLPERFTVQIRSRHAAVPARLESLQGGLAAIRFEAPQRAVTPGQAAVLYEGDVVAGGGWIQRALR